MQRLTPAALVGLAVIMLAPASMAADSTLDNTVHNLTVIASPSFGKRDATEKRFRFILPAFVEHCSDVGKAVNAADMLVVVHQHLDKAGLASEEDLLTMSNTLHRMTIQIGNRAAAVNVPLKCAEIWAMYLSSRQGGLSVEESRDGVIALTSAIYDLME